MQSPRELSLGVIDGRTPDEKLEVVYREGPDGAPEVALRQLAWGAGLGWYPQRTVPLPADLRALRALLRRAERRAARGRAHPAAARRTVVPLPDRAPAALARPASA